MILTNRRIATEDAVLRWHARTLLRRRLLVLLELELRLLLHFIEQLPFQDLLIQRWWPRERLEPLLGSRLRLLRGLAIPILIQDQRRIASVVGYY